MSEWFRQRWLRVLQELRHAPQRRYVSPAIYALYQALIPLLSQYVRGALLDVGCGDMPFKAFVEDHVTAYDSLDLYPHSEDVTFVGDVQNMAMVSSAAYDAVLCLEVLEHVPNPFQAAGEIYRVLKPGGYAVISVPHLSRLHEIPHDYFRFTRYGLQSMLVQAGFEVVLMLENGGLSSFLGHQLSTVMLSCVWPVPILRDIVWFLNKWLLTRGCYQLDRWFRFSGMFAMGYVAVAHKPV